MTEGSGFAAQRTNKLPSGLWPKFEWLPQIKRGKWPLTIASPILDGRPAQFFWQELLLKSPAGFLQELSIEALLGLA